MNKIKKRGYSFGGEIKTGFPYEDIDKNNPGPGKYDTFFKEQKGYSIRSKYEDPLEKDKNVRFSINLETWTRTISSHLKFI